MEIRLPTEFEWRDLDDVDAAIRLGDDTWPGYDATPLVPSVLTPICSPALTGRVTGGQSFLPRETILLMRARPDGWAL